MVVEPMSTATPVAAVSWKPGQQAMIRSALVHRDGDLPLARAQRLLQRCQRVQVDRDVLQPPLRLQRLLAPARSRRAAGACPAPRPRRSGAGSSVSSSIARTSARLRTTCLWTWLSGGTSMTTSPRSCAWHESRRPAAGPCCPGSAPRPPRTVRCSAVLVMPCLAKLPSPTVTWQRPQIARPPHTLSMSTPELPRRGQHGRAEREAAALARRREDDEGLPLMPSLRGATRNIPFARLLSGRSSSGSSGLTEVGATDLSRCNSQFGATLV